MAGNPQLIVRELLDRHGRLYAEDAGIRLADRPGPLYQLLVLATLDAKVTSGAHRIRLPGDRESLTGLLAASGQPARLAAALVRVSLSQRAASEITASVRD